VLADLVVDFLVPQVGLDPQTRAPRANSMMQPTSARTPPTIRMRTPATSKASSVSPAIVSDTPSTAIEPFSTQ
jgi:hypothetical protein